MNWLYSLPKPLLVTLIIVIGVAVIIFRSPPKSLCDVQKSSYKQSQMNFLFVNPDDKIKKKTFFQKNLKNCRANNSPGGCYSLFYSVNRLVKSFRLVHPKCHSSISQMKEVKAALTGIYSLFLEISWGSGPKNELSSSLSWLSGNDVSTYCKLRDQIIYFYGQVGLNQLEKSVYQRIADQSSYEKFQKFSILSENCGFYPR